MGGVFCKKSEPFLNAVFTVSVFFILLIWVVHTHQRTPPAYGPGLRLKFETLVWAEDEVTRWVGRRCRWNGQVLPRWFRGTLICRVLRPRPARPRLANKLSSGEVPLRWRQRRRRWRQPRLVNIPHWTVACVEKLLASEDRGQTDRADSGVLDRVPEGRTLNPKLAVTQISL